VHPRFSSPHVLFQAIYQYLRRSSSLAVGAAGAVAAAALAAAGHAGRLGRVFRRDARLALGGVAVAGILVAVVAAGVSAGGGPAVATPDKAAAAAQQHAPHRTAHASAAAAEHADKPSTSQHAAAKDGAAEQGAANHGAANHGAANHGAANHGAAKHASAARASAAKPSAAKPSAAKPSAPKHGAAKPSAAGHGAAAHGATRHGVARHRAVRHHSTPTRPYRIYDSVTPSAMAGHEHVATYATGNYAASPAQVAGHRSVMWIDVTGYDHAASVLDVEPGDASPSLAGSWAWHRLHEHPRALARIYTMRSMWPAVQAAVAKLPASMRAHVRYWIADPTGTPHIVPGADATQWYWGSSVDISSATPRF